MFFPPNHNAADEYMLIIMMVIMIMIFMNYMVIMLAMMTGIIADDPDIMDDHNDGDLDDLELYHGRS